MWVSLSSTVSGTSCFICKGSFLLYIEKSEAYFNYCLIIVYICMLNKLRQYII